MDDVDVAVGGVIIPFLFILFDSGVVRALPVFFVSSNFDEMVFFFFFIVTFGVNTATTPTDVLENFITLVVFFF